VRGFRFATSYAAMRVGWLPSGAGTLRPTLAVATCHTRRPRTFLLGDGFMPNAPEILAFRQHRAALLRTAVVLGLAGALAMPHAPRSLGLALALATMLSSPSKRARSSRRTRPQRSHARIADGRCSSARCVRRTSFASSPRLAACLLPLAVASTSRRPRSRGGARVVAGR